MVSAILPLIRAPIIPPNVNIEPKTEYYSIKPKKDNIREEKRMKAIIVVNKEREK